MTESEYQTEATRLRPLLISIGRQILDDTDTAEDAAQDVLLKLWQMVDELRIPIDGLARLMMRNHCISLMRSRPTFVPLSDRQTEDTQAETDERLEAMMTAVEEMPALQQTILQLRHIQGMEMKEIARLMGMNEAALRKALSRARLALRNKITVR